jgi:Fe-S-cluster containining protein
LRKQQVARSNDSGRDEVSMAAVPVDAWLRDKPTTSDTLPHAPAENDLRDTMATLPKLHADIEARVQAIRADHSDWLCRKGCDGCCRRLAEVPQLTPAEWDLLCAGLATLTQDKLGKISQAMAALDSNQSRPLICPLLDQSTKGCQVYIHRPVACRTYGFYVQRDLGLYCHDIESRVAHGALADVVWGNHDAIDQGLACLGETRSLTEWFRRWIAARLVSEPTQPMAATDLQTDDLRSPGE